VGRHWREVQGTFGRIEGREAIAAMMAKYMVEPAHFALNVHFLTSETIRVHAPDAATGAWVMLQTSTSRQRRLPPQRGASEHRLRPPGRRLADGPLRTENLFSRPVTAWNASAAAGAALAPLSSDRETRKTTP
jgi:hypothetical protein